MAARALGLIVALAALPATAALVGGGRAVWQAIAENRYLESGELYLAADLVARRAAGEVLFVAALCLPFAVAAWLAERRGGAGVAVLPFAWAVQLPLAASRVVHAAAWAESWQRLGVALPSVLWHRTRAAAVVAAIAVLLAAAAALGRERRRRAWIPRGRAARRLAAAPPLLVALVAAGSALAAGVLRPEPPTGPDVVYVTWDSTRADRLSLYGHPRPTTPELEELAAESVVYENAFSQFNWTRPSYRSILSGMHAVFDEEGWAARWSLAELLASAGYRTAGFVQNPNLEPTFGFSQGFERYRYLAPTASPRTVLASVERELTRLASGERPFLLFVHLQEPHYPYRVDNPFNRDFVAPELLAAERRDELARLADVKLPQLLRRRVVEPERLAATVDHLETLYEASIRLADRATGELVDLLRRYGRWERTLLVFNSDHGEELLEHGGLGHAGLNLHPELTRVPLLVRYPGGEGGGRRVAARVRSLDIVPTVLDVVGVEVPAQVEGESLRALDAADGWGRRALASHRSRVVVRDGALALAVDHEGGFGPLLYDLAADPGELEPLPRPRAHPAFPLLWQVSRDWTAGYLRQRERARSDEPLSPELRRQLEALGYL